MAKETFNHKDIEPAFQKKWEDAKLYETDLTKPNPYYLLFEFPYPSGDLHAGHWYAYAVTDIFARFKRMQGNNVLFPVGFDAFGLPAENAAIKEGTNPKEGTRARIERMRSQMKRIGTSVDWSKEVISSEPMYYKWTQWLFAKLYEHNLAYRAEAPVKWCPKDQTVLANEQVIDGTCERCGTEVEEKILTQWFMKITEYAERLLADLELLPWPPEIKEAQRQWIGKSEGARIAFSIPRTADRDANPKIIEVFTTRPDTIFGATYLVLAPEHPLVMALDVSNKNEVEDYVKKTSKKTAIERSEHKEKTGIELKGVKAVNPATKEDIPVYIADYALATYGTGALMAVPAHDARDHAFAKKHNLPIRVVLEEGEGYEGEGTLSNSDIFTGKNSKQARWDIVEAIGGKRATNYRMRDWLVSRQRYWGCPIPVVYDPEGKPHLIPEEHLPWLLPEDVDYTPKGKPPLASSKELHERVEKIFGEGWMPEYDTLDTFVDSSWYFFRYLDPKDDHNFTDLELAKKWMPVDRYSGGSEHTTVHLLFARFFTKALYDLALSPVFEPFTERFNRGLLMGPDGRKMSKRWGNVINPDELVEQYGADAVRMYLAFIGPYNEPGHYPWQPTGVPSMRKFLNRIFTLSQKLDEGEPSEDMRRTLAKTIAKIEKDSEKFKFNTAVSALMVLVNELEKLPKVPTSAYGTLVRLLAPFAPHLADHLFEATREQGSVHSQKWPEADAALLVEESVVVVIQVNGKKRGELVLSHDAPEDEVKKVVFEFLAIREAKRFVYVPGKIVNVVVG
ncbi:leucine--tRNA ligase [Candidatus Parcubacteria bacterium]|nr:leucine--tRNA ligase [Candidatus Parcubacteria bacterium]